MDLVINGKITDEKNAPISKVSVVIKNSKTGVTTDDNGSFRLSIPSLPAKLRLSHINYHDQEIEVTDTKEIAIKMEPSGTVMEGVVLTSKGIPTRIKDAPFSAEFISPGTILNLPTTSAYDALAYKKAFDLTSSSLTFKTPSTRGFNGSGSTRVNQLVDGMDNQAPGLNFFVGNFAGITELDNESIELLPGASSALYGPGGMNGTVLINSKNPFKYPGLSVMIKPGIMHMGNSGRGSSSIYHDYSMRWAKSFNDKFAFKISAQYISANDW